MSAPFGVGCLFAVCTTGLILVILLAWLPETQTKEKLEKLKKPQNSLSAPIVGRGNQTTLRCQENHKILIQSARYWCGSMDKKFHPICEPMNSFKEGTFSSFTTNTTMAMQNAQSQCNGKSSCTVTIQDGVLDDCTECALPVMDISFTCVPPDQFDELLQVDENR